MRKLSLVEMVMEFGTDKQMAFVLEGKKWRKESQVALVKVLESKFRVVNIVGKGYKMEFTLDEEYEVKKKLLMGVL